MQQYFNEEPAVRKAYSSIFGFFDVFGLSDGLWEVEALVATACNTQHWKKECGNLLFFMRHLEELCMAALAIHYEQGQRKDAILDMPESGQPDTSKLAHYVTPRSQGNTWDCLPRHLSSKQYHDPYKVFKKFAGTMQEMEWKKALRMLVEYALSEDSIEGAYPLYTILRMQKRLLQVVEASHLILVRTMPLTKVKV
jgi:hypothetical protein